MKLNKFLWSLSALAALGLASCSSDKLADEPENPNLVSDGTTKYITVNFQNVDNGSRSGNFDDPYEDSNPETEKALKSVRIYFFNDAGNPVKVGAYNYVDIKPTGGEADPDDDSNVDWAYEKKTVAVNVTSGANLPTKLVAVANVDLGVGNKTLNELKLEVDDYAATLANVAGDFDEDQEGNGLIGSGLVMSSSVYADNTPAECCEINLTNDKNDANSMGIFETEELAEAHATIIYLERVNAKVRMHSDMTAATGVKDTDGTTDLTNVYNVMDPKNTTNNLSMTVDGNNVEVLVQIHGWFVTAEMPQSYLFKHINANWATNLFGTTAGTPAWSHPAFFRSYWALNPTGQTLEYLHNFDTTNALALGTTAAPVSCYTQENAADDETTGAKSATGLLNDNRNTKVLVLGTIGYKGTDNKFTPITYVEWGAEKFYDDANGTSLKTKIFDSMNLGGTLNMWTTMDSDGNAITAAVAGYNATAHTVNDGYAVVEGTPNVFYRQISVADVVVVTESDVTSGYDIDDETTYATSKRYNVYLQLVNNNTLPNVGAKVNWFKYNGTAMTAYTNADINQAFLDYGGPARYWKGGQTYYFFDIKHLGEAGKPGEYGVVRNHIYDCTVKSVYGLGTPVWDPNQLIIPEKVVEDKSYISMELRVLSWRVVKNEVNLGDN